MTKTMKEHPQETTIIPGIPITHKQIEAVKTERGGWTKQQLSEWGVPWPPPKGWKEKNSDLRLSLRTLRKHPTRGAI